jgi:hypothetical protein
VGIIVRVISWCHMWVSWPSYIRITNSSRGRIVIHHSSFSISPTADDEHNDNEAEKGKPDDQTDDGSHSPHVAVVIIAVSLEGGAVSPIVTAVVVTIISPTGHLILLY